MKKDQKHERFDDDEIVPGSLQDYLERRVYGDPPEGEEPEMRSACPTVFCVPKKKKRNPK